MLECAPHQEQKLELKYCERCGGLWLRPQGSMHAYCGSCTLQLQELLPSDQISPARRYRRRTRASGRINHATHGWNTPEIQHPEVLEIAQAECAGGVNCV